MNMDVKGRIERGKGFVFKHVQRTRSMSPYPNQRNAEGAMSNSSGVELRLNTNDRVHYCIDAKLVDAISI
jgi:hypothetical protein